MPGKQASVCRKESNSRVSRHDPRTRRSSSLKRPGRLLSSNTYVCKELRASSSSNSFSFPARLHLSSLSIPVLPFPSPRSRRQSLGGPGAHLSAPAGGRGTEGPAASPRQGHCLAVLRRSPGSEALRSPQVVGRDFTRCHLQVCVCMCMHGRLLM